MLQRLSKSLKHGRGVNRAIWWQGWTSTRRMADGVPDLRRRVECMDPMIRTERRYRSLLHGAARDLRIYACTRSFQVLLMAHIRAIGAVLSPRMVLLLDAESRSIESFASFIFRVYYLENRQGTRQLGIGRVFSVRGDDWANTRAYPRLLLR